MCVCVCRRGEEEERRPYLEQVSTQARAADALDGASRAHFSTQCAGYCEQAVSGGFQEMVY